ncbi:BamA/TamA family outer membrane protein [Chitinophaga sp. sic0106]|uniref:BamA/TamA family outer membrane protein n=1 Tax=Chitinophaga sp. sic0106 TaxID=2854785 RepID=UPI001C455716|nr:BamA/TamA family outer membrane protein [Chitinophaga sp. sic0106]MBV7529732.1 BamA/TamA family outer membrane protein [Chitinophaga sp. sic0106]
MNTSCFLIRILAAVQLTILLSGVCIPTFGQDSSRTKEKWKFSLRDSLDNAIDFSDWIINAHGVIPVPNIITEPALGFGGMLAPIALHKHEQPVYAPGQKQLAPIRPDITGAAGFYTDSKSWGAAAFRTGTVVKWGLRYAIFAGYADLNLNFYKTLPLLGEVKYGTNIKSIPAFLRLRKQLGYSNWLGGVQYTFVSTKARLTDPVLPDSLFKPKEFKNLTSMPGLLIEFDNRDNMFTPNKGIKMHIDGNFSYNVFGSDMEYTHLSGFVFDYIPIGKRNKWVSGLRADYQQVIGDIPFYFKPSIDLRGIPRGRYQGNTIAVVETEQRWNVFSRWSAVFFTGVGKAFDDYADFGSAAWNYNYGTGFRYLLARKFGLYMGADVARGPEQWGFYVQFGSSWVR